MVPDQYPSETQNESAPNTEPVMPHHTMNVTNANKTPANTNNIGKI